MHRYICLALLAAVMSMSSAVHAAPGATGLLNGKLLCRDGESLSGGKVLFFNIATGPPPAQEKYWRVPERFAAIAGDGSFSAKLPPGSYYLGAIKRAAGKRIGPPEEGAVTLMAKGDNSTLKVFAVTADQTTDIGTVTLFAPPSRPASGKEITAIAGKLFDAEGKPVAGSLVLAYRSREIRGKPEFISAKSANDGSYLLRVHEGGSYYLRVRGSSGGRLVAGEIVGTYGGNEPQPVTVATGQTVTGIDIKGKGFTRNLQGPSKPPPPVTVRDQN